MEDDLPWKVVAFRNEEFVLAAFRTEAAARDYARWRNGGRRSWRVRER